jgi:hypothetical protein
MTGNVKTTKANGRVKEIRTRVDMYMRREWKELHVRSAPALSRPRSKERTEEETLKGVLSDIEKGKTGRARRILGSKGILDITNPEVQEAVKSKYPQEEVFTKPEGARGWTPMECMVEMGEDNLHTFSSLEYSLDFKLPDGRAAGLGGTTYERIRSVARDRTHRAHLCAYAEELVNGSAPEEVINFYKAKQIVPLAKKKGSLDVRPIAVGECMRRWAAISIGVEITGHAGRWPVSELPSKLEGRGRDDVPDHRVSPTPLPKTDHSENGRDQWIQRTQKNCDLGGDPETGLPKSGEVYDHLLHRRVSSGGWKGGVCGNAGDGSGPGGPPGAPTIRCGHMDIV